MAELCGLTLQRCIKQRYRIDHLRPINHLRRGVSCFGIAVGCALLAGTGCQTLLDIQQAEVDPSLDTDPNDSPPPRPTPPSPPANAADAGGGSAETSSAPASEECAQGFDNRRVKRLNADGTLPALPDAPTPTESQ